MRPLPSGRLRSSERGSGRLSAAWRRRRSAFTMIRGSWQQRSSGTVCDGCSCRRLCTGWWGGWQTLVDGLASRARQLGVRIECGRSVGVLPPAPVIVALELRDAAKLLGRKLDCPSGSGVIVDVGLESRRGDPGTIIDLDGGVLLQAQHHSAAPDGHRLFQAYSGVGPGKTADDGVRRIESVLDRACAAWRGRTAWRRRMVAKARTGAVDYPGMTWRDRPSVEQGDGIFLAGDMVAAPGLLSEVSFNSAAEAARRAAAWAAGARSE